MPGTGHFEHEHTKKGQEKKSTDILYLNQPMKNWQPHLNIEIRDGFGIPVNLFWTTWTTPRTNSMLQRAIATFHKVCLERATSNSNTPRKDMKNNRRIESILTHPIKTWQPHPNIEIRDGLGIHINLF